MLPSLVRLTLDTDAEKRDLDEAGGGDDGSQPDSKQRLIQRVAAQPAEEFLRTFKRGPCAAEPRSILADPSLGPKAVAELAVMQFYQSGFDLPLNVGVSNIYKDGALVPFLPPFLSIDRINPVAPRYHSRQLAAFYLLFNETAELFAKERLKDGKYADDASFVEKLEHDNSVFGAFFDPKDQIVAEYPEVWQRMSLIQKLLFPVYWPVYTSKNLVDLYWDPTSESATKTLAVTADDERKESDKAVLEELFPEPQATMVRLAKTYASTLLRAFNGQFALTTPEFVIVFRGLKMKQSDKYDDAYNLWLVRGGPPNKDGSQKTIPDGREYPTSSAMLENLQPTLSLSMHSTSTSYDRAAEFQNGGTVYREACCVVAFVLSPGVRCLPLTSTDPSGTSKIGYRWQPILKRMTTTEANTTLYDGKEENEILLPPGLAYELIDRRDPDKYGGMLGGLAGNPNLPLRKYNGRKGFQEIITELEDANKGLRGFKTAIVGLKKCKRVYWVTDNGDTDFTTHPGILDPAMPTPTPTQTTPMAS